MRPGSLLPTCVAAKVRYSPRFPHRVWLAGHHTGNGVHLFRGQSYHLGEEIQDSQQDDRCDPKWR